jgi:hypothetical protein
MPILNEFSLWHKDVLNMLLAGLNFLNLIFILNKKSFFSTIKFLLKEIEAFTIQRF